MFRGKEQTHSLTKHCRDKHVLATGHHRPVTSLNHFKLFGIHKLLKEQYMQDSKIPRLHLQLRKPFTMYDTRPGSLCEMLLPIGSWPGYQPGSWIRTNTALLLPSPSTAQLVQFSYPPRGLLIAASLLIFAHSR